MEEEFVYVIIPTFNRGDMLPVAIESVLSQDYPYIKIVVIDDGSSDNTKDICIELKKKYPTNILYLYQFEENCGCASARNKGLDLIRGREGYICFLDSDDALLPGKFSREITLLKNNPDADFTFSDSIIFYQESGKEHLAKVAAFENPENFASEHFLSNEAKPAAILYRGKVFRTLRFREDMRYNEDSELLQRVAIEFKGVYCPLPGCWVRWHKGSKSRNVVEINKAVLKASMHILSAYPDFYRSFAAIADRRIRQIKRSLFEELIVREQWNEARDYARTFTERMMVGRHYRFFFLLRRNVFSVYFSLKGYTAAFLKRLKCR